MIEQDVLEILSVIFTLLPLFGICITLYFMFNQQNKRDDNSLYTTRVKATTIKNEYQIVKQMCPTLDNIPSYLWSNIFPETQQMIIDERVKMVEQKTKLQDSKSLDEFSKWGELLN